MSIFGYRRSARPQEITIRISVFVEPDEEGYHAFNPAFPGLHADGGTEEEAIRNFAEAVPAYLESLVKHGDPLPVGCSFVSREDAEHTPTIPMGAFMRHIELQWHSPETTGVS